MTYDVDYFIRKFGAIPEEKWSQNSFYFDNNTGLGCALGWCGFKDNSDERPPAEGLALCRVLGKDVGWVINLNDGNYLKYPQPTPKQRILAALSDIKKMQPPKREKVKPEIASDLLTFPIQERLDTILESQIKNN